MPDVFDPYEERGVPNPHQPIETDRAFWPTHIGEAKAASYDLDPTDAEKDAWRAELADRERRRIAPGFYEGVRPPAP